MDNNITIYPFKFKHFKQLQEILISQSYAGVSDIQMKTLPKTGFIAFLGKTPIAAGFLRRLEPCYAQIDTLCSNKYLGSLVRHQGLNAVIDALINEAHVLKLEGLICHTESPDVLKRSESLGFHVIKQHIIAKPLKTDK